METPISLKQSENNFIEKDNSSFLQAEEWAEFQEHWGRKVWRIVLETGGSESLCFRYELPLNKNYLYCPRLTFGSKQEWQQALEKIKIIAGQEKSVFLKIDPELIAEQIKEFSLEELGFIKSFKQIQPKSTLILDITKSEEELLKQMKPKTRYNIKLAQRKDLRIITGESLDDKEKYFDRFWRLMRETARRNGFHLHSRNYYQRQLSLPFIKLFLIEYRREIMAGATTVFFGRRATYLHGASSDNYKNLMAPYLLHWEIIKRVKQEGFKEYDFWGISGGDDSQNWIGITKFKKGFGGKEVRYIGAYDWVFSKPWYGIYKLGRKILNK